MLEAVLLGNIERCPVLYLLHEHQLLLLLPLAVIIILHHLPGGNRRVLHIDENLALIQSSILALSEGDLKTILGIVPVGGLLVLHHRGIFVILGERAKTDRDSRPRTHD